MQLFKERGWDEILNADLVHGALSVAGFVSAAVGAIAGGGLAWTLDKGPEKASHAAIAAFLVHGARILMFGRRERPRP